MASETFEVSLHGGSPWGFRLQGGKEFRAPLLIAKVTPGSKAAKEGIIVGDLLISINNEPCDDMTHSNALNCIKKTGKELVLMLERRPYDGTVTYSHSSSSLPRGTKLANGVGTNNNEYKSVEGYATLPRSNASYNQKKNVEALEYDNGYDVEDRGEEKRPDSLGTSSSGVSSRYSDEADVFSSRGYGTMSPSNDDWSPDLISDAVRTPQPIRLVSRDESSMPPQTNAETSRVKSPTTIHGFTDKPAPVGRGVRRNNDEEINDLKDNPLLNSGSTANEDELAEHDSASEQPYRRYSYHGSVFNDPEPKSDVTERPRIQAGSGWYKELFKEMHTGAGNSTGLSSLLAGDASPPKNDARGLFKGYRERPAQQSVVRATKTQDTQAEPSSSSQTSRFSRPASRSDKDPTYRYSTSSLPSSTPNNSTARTDGVQMREKPTTRSNVPSWYRELQKGNEVSEEEIIEDRKQVKQYQAPGGSRSPRDIGPEYPVVRSFSLGSRAPSGPVVHHDPPQKLNTQTYQQRNDVSKPEMRYAAATRNTAPSVKEKEPDKPSATNLYEDHMRNRQLSPRPERRYERPQPVDFVKQFQEEEERLKEDERRAKEDLERKLREENRAKAEAEQRQREMEQRQREMEQRKKDEMQVRQHPKRARALYNFSPQSPKEIAFRKGDIIAFYRTIDANWCEGESQGQIGLFPASYVEILEENVMKTEGEGRVKYNFKAESPRELNLQKGDIVAITRQIDKNWFEGVKDDRLGIFPVSYIEVLREPGEQPQQISPRRVQEQITKQNGLPEVHSTPSGFSQQRNYDESASDPAIAPEPDINNLDGETFTVVFTYTPQNEDELELLEGDFVKVVEKCDDGWFVGISERTGDFGTFPGNYVKKIA